MVKVSASFRIMSKVVDPVEISRLLNLESSLSHKQGDQNIGRSGEVFSNFLEGLWTLDSSMDESATVNDHLKYLISKLLGSKIHLRELRQRGYRLDILIGIFGVDGNAGYAINAENLSDLAGLGVELEFDIYSV